MIMRLASLPSLIFSYFYQSMYKQSQRASKAKSLIQRNPESLIQDHSRILPSIRLKTSLDLQSKDYNRYYINPILRYKKRACNPKQSPEHYNDETYIYRNLHNDKYWNWVHPLVESHCRNKKKDINQKINVPMLARFKQYMEERTGKRLPIIVKEILQQE